MDLEHFRNRLLARRDALETVAEQASAATDTVELDQTRVGRVSRMDALQGQAMASATQARRGLELRRIASALERIETGVYGICLRCGDDIATARLEADPAASVCIECAQAAENGP